MKKILITHLSFTGEVELLFREDGTLVKMDTSNCNMTTAITNGFKNRVPAHINHLQEAFDGKNVVIREAEYEVTFEMFWNAYNKKINRLRCIKLWDKLNKTDRALAYVGIKEYDRYLFKNEWRGKADPETYLRNRYWENEYK